MGPTEIDNTNEGKKSIPLTRENVLDLRPVSPEESGEGLPYAPENWPEPGDKWRWKTGRRVTISGHFLDRYLYLPKRLHRHRDSRSNSMSWKRSFKSKLSVEKFIQEAFPGTDIGAFFASFSWKIPAKNHPFSKGKSPYCSPSPIPYEEAEEIATSSSYSGISYCKIGNRMCALNQNENVPIAANWCKACCEDEQFCRDCCCILCKKPVSSAYGGYNYVKCEAKVGKDNICGHLGHILCSLRCYMAGTVGGSFGIDTEYICRRCDAKSNLLPHVERLLATSKSIDNIDDIQRILDLGVCILRGSQKQRAKVLLTDIEFAIEKLKVGISIEDVWKKDDGSHSAFAVRDLAITE